MSVVVYRICFSGTATIDTSLLFPAGADYQPLLSNTVRTSQCLPNASISGGRTSSTIQGIRVRSDTDDEPDETVIATLSIVLAPASVTLGTSTATHTIQDDDPTVVTLSRLSSNTGALSEGGSKKAEFQVELGRALIAGERIDVPLAITGVSASDIEDLAKKAGETNTGVTVRSAGTLTPTVSFEGAGAQTAVLEIAVTDDSASESTETMTVALSRAHTADVEFELCFGGTATEGASGDWVLGVGDMLGGDGCGTATTIPAGGTTDTVEVTVTEAGGYASAGTHQVTIPASGTATLTVATTGDDADEPDGSVTATLEAGTGYTVSATAAAATVAVADDDDPPPATLAERIEAVIEADRAAGRNVTVWERALATVRGETPPGGKIDEAEARKYLDLHRARVERGIEASRPFAALWRDILAFLAGEAGTETPAAPEISIAGGSGVTEGGSASFTLTADTAPSSDLDVTVTVSERAGSDFVASGDEGARTVTIPANRTTASFTVATVDDGTDEPDGAVKAALDTGAGYGVAAAPGNAAEVAVKDNDDAVAVTVSFVDKHMEAPEGGLFEYRVSLSAPAPHRVSMIWIVENGTTTYGDFRNWHGGVSFGKGQRTKTISIFPENDNHDEGRETFTVRLSHPVGATAPEGGAIENPAAANGAALRAMAEVARGFDSGSGAHAGRFGAAGTGWGPDSPHAVQSQTMTGREFLLGSSFSLTGAKDASGGSMAFWGRASQGRFDGREDEVSLDGEVTTGMLGADYARGKWLLGLALTRSTGEGGYRGEPGQDDDRGANGRIESTLTAAIPYASWRASGRLSLWGAAGFGAGEVTLKPDPGSESGAGGLDPMKADTGWTMAALGARGELLQPPADGSGGPALALLSDAMWARTTSDRTADLAASESDVTRLRLGLEGSWIVGLDGGGSLTPKLELGLRQDGGDAETGFGVELGGGIAWTDPKLGLSLDIAGRTLLAHEADGLKDRGFSASVAYDPDPASERGLSLSLRQEMGGPAQGGLDALFANDPLEDRTGSEATSRWTAEAAYGFPAFSGRFTGSPHVGLGMSTGARDYSVGWRLTPAARPGAPDLSFGVKATRNESDTAPPEHRFGFEATARW